MQNRDSLSSIVSWLKDFWKAENPGPTDPLLWHCRPLLICDAVDRTVFEGAEIDVEYTPDGKTPQSGVARIVNWDGPLPVPELEVREMEIRGMDTGGARGGPCSGREGAILKGRYQGDPFTWYTDGEADDYAAAAKGGPAVK